ncbi:SRPBCC family protein [Mycobacterium sp. 21AC1]|uniref:SRPBCC family protein n=1 Tax=[Mycobacterium] appelbergii TaxID=2939269 RepID=UPI0029390470|nr:SRPBCC family protein [Mycobacterium sp. 21AC1]MDV3126203.1 SRPBCC family protein [Mycobacterium sp. 21AC1]
MSWWIADAHRTVTGDIPAPPRQVRDFYVNLENITRVHPLVVSVRRTSGTESAGASVRTYRVSDRIRLGPLPLRITYQTCIAVSASGTVTAQARQFPRVGLDSTVAFEPVDGGTRVTEALHITAPRPLLPLTVTEAVNAHTAMLAAIRELFEND